MRLVATSAAVLLLTACPSAPPKDSKYPPRPEGCDVKVYPENPAEQTDNIGPVTATCALDVSTEDCTRTLKDQACKLGADVIWGVEPPDTSGGKKHLAGRAAHTRSGVRTGK